jgi:hypothetical protein
MRLKMLATIFIGVLALAAECAAQEGSGKQGDSSGGLRQVIYPPE